VETRSDAELVALARAGDKRAFGQLIERYQETARRITLSMVPHAEIARDLVQEAMLQAYLSLDHLRDDQRFGGWLYGILLNVCRSYLRSQKMILLSFDALAGGIRFETVYATGFAPDPQDIAETRELHRAVLEAVNQLSPKNRAATLLFYYDQLSLEETAAVLGVSVGAVKGRLHNARKQLRAQLLPIYTERNRPIQTPQRRSVMVKVNVVDVVKRQRTDDEGQQVPPWYVVVLFDEAGQRALPIWLGPFEAERIVMNLRDIPLVRPLTDTFISNLLTAVGAELEEVRVEAIKDDTFYAVAKLRSGDTVQEVDARPSDAIALALRMDSPIYVSEEVLDRAGSPVPGDIERTRIGKGLDAIWEDAERQREALQVQARSLRRTPEEVERMRQELISYVFG